MADPDTTLAALRAATRHMHATLDARLRLAHQPSTRDVRLYLTAMLGFLGPVERVLWEHPSRARLEPGRRRAKARWLRADLARLGAEALEAEAEVPRAAREASGGLGVAYVLEGSTLGGRVLARRPALAGWRFFEGYGDDTGSLWRALVAELERVGKAPQARAAIVAGAVEAFEAITSWLGARGALRAAPLPMEPRP